MLSMETLALARAYADKIKQQVGAGFTPQIVESLPTIGESTILYLVLKKGTTPQGNIYDEYLWIDGVYEHIGDTTTLITVDDALSTTSENPVQNKVITLALDTKVNKETGKVLSTNDYTNADKATVNYSKTLQDGFIKPLNKDNNGLIFHNPDAMTDSVVAVDDTISASSVGVPKSTAVKSFIESYINSLDANEVEY